MTQSSGSRQRKGMIKRLRDEVSLFLLTRKMMKEGIRPRSDPYTDSETPLGNVALIPKIDEYADINLKQPFKDEVFILDKDEQGDYSLSALSDMVRQVSVPDASDFFGPPVCLDLQAPNYEFKREIGSGTWGIIFEVLHVGHPYILKVPNDEVDLTVKGNKKIVEVFGEGDIEKALDEIMMSEARNAAFLCDEENDDLIIEKGKYVPIVPFHGNTTVIYKWKHKRANVYSRLSGKTLKEIFEEKGALNIDEFLEIMPEVAYAVNFLHINDFSHNDLKPDNIFYNWKRGQAKLIDLAFAKTGDYSGSLIGKRVYTDPMRLMGAHSSSIKGDIYSFGVIMYESLTGKMPIDFGEYHEKDLSERLVAEGIKKPVDIRVYAPEIEDDIADLIMECISTDVEKRPESMSTVRERLKQASDNHMRIAHRKDKRYHV